MWGPSYYRSSLSEADEEPATSPAPPSREQMKKRWHFRRSVQEQTLLHRRVHRHDGLGETGRNIALSLVDRQLYGAHHCVRRRLPRGRILDATRDRGPNSSKSGGGSRATENTDRPPSSLRRSPLYPTTVLREIQTFAEYSSVVRYQSAYLRHLGGEEESDDESVDAEEERSSSSRAISTISIAFSSDKLTMASTHGDHTVKITSCATGNLLCSLAGHPRTPWTVKYHPSNPHILASGCLGFQVRVWNWMENKCLHMIRFDHAIISLSFHPAGHILAVASGSQLNFWDYDNFGGNRLEDTVSNRFSSQQQTRGAVVELEQRHMLRCVHFPPNGTTIIVGGMNPTPDDPRHRPGRGRGGMSGGGMSFYLRLWDFDEESVLHPYSDNEDRSARASIRLQRKALSNPRTFVPRALLYNDGGFDVSPDGKVLCACAEYWLPDGVNSAMEMLQREETEDESSSEDEELSVVDEDDESAVPMSPSTVMATPTSTPQNAPEEATPDEGDGERMETPVSEEQNSSETFTTPPRRTPRNSVSGAESSSAETNPITPPNPSRNQPQLSPPPPPGLRFSGGLGENQSASGRGSGRRILQPMPSSRTVYASSTQNGQSNVPIPPPPPPAQHLPVRPPHPLSLVTGSVVDLDVTQQPGRYVPHVVTVSLDTSPINPAALPEGQRTSVARGYRPRLGQLLEAAPLDGAKASAVTCVKFSPSADFCLLGYGVREPASSEDGEDSLYHPVTALYRVRGGMMHVSTMLSGDDDVNIARFHPDSGYGFVYGTKQGRVRVLSPRLWHYYSPM